MSTAQIILWVLATIAFGLAAWRPIFRATVHLGWVGATLVGLAVLVGTF
jgi:hypothetical protein